MPSLPVGLQAHRKSGSKALPNSNVFLFQVSGGAPAPSVTLHPHNRTGSGITGTHYDPLFEDRRLAVEISEKAIEQVAPFFRICANRLINSRIGSFHIKIIRGV